ncbi:radical SAM protein [Candidatus Falkowbacteria bacterium]|nr:radical SAM protein [Candidatus Falkowbacteria bacterium]
MNIKEINCKTALTSSKLPEADYCINPYIGCLHKCVYCYACFMKRFTNHPEDWGEFLDVKVNAADILNGELVKKSKRKGSIFLGSVTDVYQPAEKKFQITRKILEVLAKYDFPVSILTKSELVVRDINLLKKISDCEVGLTITSLNDKISNIFEPGASIPAKRLDALAILKSSGLKTYAFVGPILPGLTDLKLIIPTLQGKIDFIMFEALNYGKFNSDKINLAYTEAGSNIPIFSNINWDEIESEARELSQIYRIPVKGFYRH